MKSVRYGRRIRMLATAADVTKVKAYECPKCGKVKVKRKYYSVWKCKSCDAVYAGGAYTFLTPTGQTVRRIVQEMKVG